MYLFLSFGKAPEIYLLKKDSWTQNKMGDIGNLACLTILILSITSFCCGNEVLEEIIAKRVNFDKRISDLEEQDKQKERRILKLEKTIGILLAEINKKSSQTELEALKVSFLNFPEQPIFLKVDPNPVKMFRQFITDTKL